MLNLAFILKNGFGKVVQDHSEALLLLEDAVRGANAVSARVMLAYALS
ncbi:hypothetical protein BWQ96_10075 [Gracilariopsis chorda]|uniref:Uncharacterized protein n=1 Tax=Gracilariopsis chorda TaxID=448386 RepID=A0A2V3IGE3_9FLOR|nr:hypothetical protein BWQ96_10075 [Gracilariopsis chorda]|eukprot:PXF40220.1 hypothetical protein BWQ96_10075 [Gracilariopsis chorda]